MNEEQLIMEAWVYGGLSILLIIGMLWMVYQEKKKYNGEWGKKKGRK